MKLSDVFNHYAVDENGCWNWTLGKSKGYGAINSMGRVWAAHRVAYELTKGPIPDGLSICHRCDNPSCINPDHLFAGTHKENMHDKIAKGRSNNKGVPGERHPRSMLTSSRVTALLKDYVAGVPRKKLASKYGLSEYSLSSYTDGKAWKHLHGKNGCPTLAELKEAKRKSPVTDDDAREIWRLHFERKSIPQIAKLMGFSVDSISNLVTGRTFRHLPDAPPIEALKEGGAERGTNQFNGVADTRDIHPTAKIRTADIPAILARLAAGETLEAVGKTYGVKRTAIWHIKRKYAPLPSAVD